MIDGIFKRRFSQQVIEENSEGESEDENFLEDELLETDRSNFDDALQKKFKIKFIIVIYTLSLSENESVTV